MGRPTRSPIWSSRQVEWHCATTGGRTGGEGAIPAQLAAAQLGRKQDGYSASRLLGLLYGRRHAGEKRGDLFDDFWGRGAGCGGAEGKRASGLEPSSLRVRGRLCRLVCAVLACRGRWPCAARNAAETSCTKLLARGGWHLQALAHYSDAGTEITGRSGAAHCKLHVEWSVLASD